MKLLHVKQANGFIELEKAIIADDLIGDTGRLLGSIALRLPAFDVDIRFGYSLDQYVAIIVHANFDALK